MDKKLLILIVVALILIVFRGRIKTYMATLNSVQKLMLGQIVILMGALVILTYYIVARSKEE